MPGGTNEIIAEGDMYCCTGCTGDHNRDMYCAVLVDCTAMYCNVLGAVLAILAVLGLYWPQKRS